MPVPKTDSNATPREKRRAAFLPHLDVLAHTGRSLLVARELRCRGWNVHFCGAGKYERIVREAGFDVKPLPEMPAEGLVAESRRGRRWPFHSPAQIRPFVAAELDCLERAPVDVVVFDHRYTAGISAEIAGLPRASITNIWWTPYDATGMGLAETHPVFASLPRLRFARRFPGAGSLGNILARVMFKRWIKPYNAVRAEYGLAPLGSILDLFAGDAVILPDTPELAPARDLPPHCRFVGPLVWEPEGALPEEVAALGEFIYVTMGSSADPAVFDTVVEAVRNLGSVPAVITTGGVRRADEFKGLPERILLYDFLPGSAAARNASCVVCQGGIGTIYQALSAGKPLVGVPFMPEQEVYGIGAVEHLGAGITVSPYGLTAERLAAAISTVLGEEHFRRAAVALSSKIDLTTGPTLAADAIEAVTQTA